MSVFWLCRSRICVKNIPKYVAEDRLRDFFSQKGEITDVSYGINAAGDSEVTYKIDDLYYPIKITASGETNVIGEATTTEPVLSVPNFAAKINASNFGDYVNYNKDLELTDGEYWITISADADGKFSFVIPWATEDNGVWTNG